jgi:hypothetical protein
MKYLRQLRPSHLGFLVVLSLVTIAFGIGAQTLQAAPPGVARLAGPWQAALVWSGSGCGPMSGVVNFTLDKTGVDHKATLRTHGACGESRTTETFRIDSLNSDGSGMAGLTCHSGVACGWVLTIQVDRKGTIFNMADIEPTNPLNYVAGTAIRQGSAEDGEQEGNNGK